MTKELRDEVRAIAESGTATDMDTNGRLAIIALLKTVDDATLVIDCARNLYDVLRGTMAAQTKTGIALRDAIAEWDKLGDEQKAEAAN